MARVFPRTLSGRAGRGLSGRQGPGPRLGPGRRVFFVRVSENGLLFKKAGFIKPVSGGGTMPPANRETLFAAFKSKDSRFDGRFFVGVSSTGVYCRPICRAKLPKPGNCEFFATAAEAERAGYRPCLLCRQELSPGSAIVDSTD